MPRRPFIANQGTAIFFGLMLFIGGAILLWDAYERRGARTPLILRPFLPT
jgi:hypothetical protein